VLAGGRAGPAFTTPALARLSSLEQSRALAVTAIARLALQLGQLPGADHQC
jgi:hypothetical protein